MGEGIYWKVFKFLVYFGDFVFFIMGRFFFVGV